jgi:hypothetical protein
MSRTLLRKGISGLDWKLTQLIVIEQSFCGVFFAGVVSAEEWIQGELCHGEQFGSLRRSSGV